MDSIKYVLVLAVALATLSTYVTSDSNGCLKKSYKRHEEACTCSDHCVGGTYCQRNGSDTNSYFCLCGPCQVFNEDLHSCVTLPGFGDPCTDVCAYNLVCFNTSLGTSQDDQDCFTCVCPPGSTFNADTHMCEDTTTTTTTTTTSTTTTTTTPTTFSTTTATTATEPTTTAATTTEPTTTAATTTEPTTTAATTTEPPTTTTTSASTTSTTAASSAGTCVVSSNGCTGLSNGFYAACIPECETGVYYYCQSEQDTQMFCGYGSYYDSNGQLVQTARLVYNGVTGVCDWKVASCPRSLDVYV